MPRLRIAAPNDVGLVAKMALSIAICLSIAACSNASPDSGTDSSGSQQEEDPWVETLVQNGYQWNGTYEGIGSETENTYEVDEGKAVGVYTEQRHYGTAHWYFSDYSTHYMRWWDKDEHDRYTKGEEGYIEEDGSRVEEVEYSYACEYDDEGRPIKNTTKAKNADGSTSVSVEEGEYDESGEYRTTALVIEGESVPIVYSDNDIVRSNSHGDKLYYETDDSGETHLSHVNICDDNGRILYIIGESPYSIDELPSSFDIELSDVSGSLVTGYAYDERDNVVETVIWDNDSIRVIHNCYANNGHLVYNTNYLNVLNDPGEQSADISTHQYTNYKTGEKTELLDPSDVRVQITPILVNPLPDYLAQR